MNKVFAVATIVLGLSLILVAPVYAVQRRLPTSAPTPTPTPTPTVVPVNSFELFWPLVAGKTEGDSFYSLKLIKEQVQGWFIFDGSKKADYQVFLGTKRVLESEKLIKESKAKNAEKTLERASSNFSRAYDFAKTAGDKGNFDAGKVRKDRLFNVKTLIDSLKVFAPSDLNIGLDVVRGKADRLLSDYLP
ncbi:MAG: hypothetical protein HYU80_02020 [Candidatus Blackburnbacteria bacterium]|nr:hypothetical protein [Candidatus Blackburnbacteria bacterium]